MSLSRDVPLKPDQSALLFIDVQNFCVHREGGEFKGLNDDEINAKYGWYFETLEPDGHSQYAKDCRPPAATPASRSCTRRSKA